MRRLDAIFSDRRNSVSSSNSVGNTEKSTARLSCTADRNTRIEAAIEQASSMSMTKAGTGTTITNRTLIAATGNTRLRSALIPPPGAAVPKVIAPALIA
jgi:Tfp pilus assembly protein FimV